MCRVVGLLGVQGVLGVEGCRGQVRFKATTRIPTSVEQYSIIVPLE